MRYVGAAPRATPPTVDNQLASVARTPLQRCHAPPYFPRAPRCRSIQMLHALLAPACSSSSPPTFVPLGHHSLDSDSHATWRSSSARSSSARSASARSGCSPTRLTAARRCGDARAAAFVSPAATWSNAQRAPILVPGYQAYKWPWGATK